jgi:hypothetical protein
MTTMPLPSTTPPMSANKFRRQTCPPCGSKDIHRCRGRGIIERHVVVCAFHFFSALVRRLRALGVYSKHVGGIEVFADGD